MHVRDGFVPNGRHTRKISGRLWMVRLPEHEARKARKRARQEHGASINADTLEAIRCMQGDVLVISVDTHQKEGARRQFQEGERPA